VEPRPLLDVRQLEKQFVRRRLWRAPVVTRAVDDVSFAIAQGESVGLVGESGSGKTTAARCILGLIRPTSGDVSFNGESIVGMSRARLRAVRRAMQPVFQDPYSSLNPRHKVGKSIVEPLLVHGVGTATSREARVAELLDLVGLDRAYGTRRPDELSGGQRQRIALARALALSPQLLVLDEPVSALDTSVAAQIVNLLLRLRKDLNLALLFITHDLRLVRHLTTRVAVMRQGRIVELAPTDALFSAPRHPYTQELLAVANDHATSAGQDQDRGQVGQDDNTPVLPLRQVGPAHWARM
jgi:ABC-type glutathione transport system ATPase component